MSPVRQSFELRHLRFMICLTVAYAGGASQKDTSLSTSLCVRDCVSIPWNCAREWNRTVRTPAGKWTASTRYPQSCISLLSSWNASARIFEIPKWLTGRSAQNTLRNIGPNLNHSEGDVIVMIRNEAYRETSISLLNRFAACLEFHVSPCQSDRDSMFAISNQCWRNITSLAT